MARSALEVRSILKSTVAVDLILSRHTGHDTSIYAILYKIDATDGQGKYVACMRIWPISGCVL